MPNPLASVLLLALATAPPGEVQVGIVPPDGWPRVTTHGSNLLAAWKDPSGHALVQNLTLGRDDSPQSLDEYARAAEKSLGTSLPDSTPTLAKVTMCDGREHAYLIAGTGRVAGVRVRIEELVTEIGGKKVIGTYTRPDADAAASGAEAALRSICPRT